MNQLQFLIAKLNNVCRSASESAAATCMARTNFEVDLEHVLLALLDRADSDAARIFAHFGLDTLRLSRDLNAAQSRLAQGNSRTPVLSARLVKLLTEAWTVASIEFGALEIRSAMLLLALMGTEELARLAEAGSQEFLKLNAGAMRQRWQSLLSPAEGPAGAPRDAAGGIAPGAPNLDQFTVDLTAAACRGAIDPVLGRDAEIRQVIDILTRRRQNNPILIGEAGVGKTAIVEGFALRVAQGDVPPSLRKVSVRALDIGLLQAGAGVRGEFESRLKGVIAEVAAAPQPVILFIDEAHTLIGTAATAGTSDAANLLKPALARGELRTIAATTHAEYRRYFERDAALARRFQVIRVEEPGEEAAIHMMRGLAPLLEKHHQVRLLDEGIQAGVRLSHRYITGRQLPDKAVSVLDTACARVALAQTSTPAPLEDCQRRIALLENEAQSLQRESSAGSDHQMRLAALFDELAAAETQLADLEDRCSSERRLVRRILELRAALEQNGDGEPDSAAREELSRLSAELAALQGDAPLVQACVDARTVAEVISAWTGVPIGRMLRDEIHTVLNLANLLGERVIGQPHALQTIAKRIRTARAGIEDPHRPTGVFLLVGPSGVGKTETALALAEILYGGERNAVVLNMSEYQEAHSVSGLKGSPPGYVGYGEGGVLTEAVRRRPYCILLLDEMEKAHQDVMELFYQVFDKGKMEDAQGREVDFRNTVILMTSNTGSATIQKVCDAGRTPPDPETLTLALMDELSAVFKPALLGRLVVVPYYPIGESALRQIVELKLEHIRGRLAESHRIEFEYGESLVEEVAARCVVAESGARNVDHILTGTLLPEISRRLLGAMADHSSFQRISVDAAPGGAWRYQVE